ncbi:hypothetical protein LWF15_24390 [Kineosporia rhizophila]|uniref:hypothetical protein n=1 Tax=Kineosporia rhizophila TaxID=84633 RepID=UPI001E424B60|nr:hypothetical protein [Kineosporia rhizophila]MCE0538643.1 hypothetical protein [Kineosporia rhizophila]
MDDDEVLRQPLEVPAAELLVYLRRNGIAVREAWDLPGGALLSYEPALAQAQIAEGLLLAQPGIGTVDHVGPGLLHARRCLQPEGQQRRNGRAGPARMFRALSGWPRGVRR